MSVQVDVRLDPITGDLPEISQFVTGMDLIEQRVRLRLHRGTGEWFLDPSVGLPLLDWRQMKPPDIQSIVGRLQQEIREIPGVVACRNFDGVHDYTNRRLTITGDVIAADLQVTSLVAFAPTDVARNTFHFAIFFSRASGPIVRPAFRGF